MTYYCAYCSKIPCICEPGILSDQGTPTKQMTNQYALGYKAGLEAAVKVCRNRTPTDADGYCSVAEAIAALPVPEVQWRDDEALDALQDMVRTLTDGPDDSDVARVFNKARAVIAKSKEKQK